MKGVTFGDIHTSDFGVYFSSVVIGEAAVKSCCLDIPGASGSLDLTDFFGVVAYENRSLLFEFTFVQRNSALLSAYSDFLNALHGREFSIILDDDPDFHYIGRVSVGELKKGAVSTVSVVCDCQPYKYSNSSNSVTITVEGIEFPDSWLYGDVDGDGEVTADDVTAVSRLIGKKSFESDGALRADFDFDGVVTETEKTVLENYLEYGSGKTFREYVCTDPVSFSFKNCRRVTIDFGDAPVDVTFTRVRMSRTNLWSLRIDNIPEFSLHGYKSHTARLCGKHEIMIVTSDANETGEFQVSWDNTGVL